MLLQWVEKPAVLWQWLGPTGPLPVERKGGEPTVNTVVGAPGKEGPPGPPGKDGEDAMSDPGDIFVLALENAMV